MQVQWDKSKSHKEILKNPKIKYLVEILKLAGYLTNCLCKSVMNIQTANLVHLYTKAWHFTDGLFLKVIFWDLNFDISVISKLVTSILTFSVLVQAQEKRIGIKPSAVETVVARWCLRSKVWHLYQKIIFWSLLSQIPIWPQNTLGSLFQMFDLHYDHLPVLIFSAPHGKRGVCDRRNRQLGSFLQPQLCFHVLTQINNL